MGCKLLPFKFSVEHALSDLAGIVLIIDCQSHENQIEAFTKASFPWVFDIIPYNQVIGFFTLVRNRK